MPDDIFGQLIRLGGRYLGWIDGKFADSLALTGAGIENGESSAVGQTAGLHGLRQGKWDLQAEHFGIGVQTGQPDGKTAKCSAIRPFGRLESVIAGQFQHVTAAGAVDDRVHGDPFRLGIGNLNGGQTIPFTTDVHEFAAEAQFSIRFRTDFGQGAFPDPRAEIQERGLGQIGGG